MISNITSHFRFAIPARIAGLLALLLITFGTVKAQLVLGTQAIDFGDLNRSGRSTVLYSDAGSAQFSVIARSGKKTRLTVSSVALTRSTRTLPITINTSDCAFSTDGGTTWTVFSTGTLFHDVTAPNGIFNLGTILVKVGGSVTASSTQQRGDYSGSITLTAVYR
jgi:hypothetical protein